MKYNTEEIDNLISQITAETDVPEATVEAYARSVVARNRLDGKDRVIPRPEEVLSDLKADGILEAARILNKRDGE